MTKTIAPPNQERNNGLAEDEVQQLLAPPQRHSYPHFHEDADRWLAASAELFLANYDLRRKSAHPTMAGVPQAIAHEYEVRQRWAKVQHHHPERLHPNIHLSDYWQKAKLMAAMLEHRVLDIRRLINGAPADPW